MKLPTFKNIVYMPSENKTGGNSASYNGKYILKNNNLELEEEITLNKRVYDNSDWTDFRNVVIAQENLNNEKIIIQYKN
jgi:hypothetical protein